MVQGQPIQKFLKTPFQLISQVVAPACNPSYKGNINRRIAVQASTGIKARPYLKITKAERAGSMTQGVEFLSSKCESLSSNPEPPIRKKKKKNKRRLFMYVNYFFQIYIKNFSAT
jgi:hypothetical protein